MSSGEKVSGFERRSPQNMAGRIANPEDDFWTTAFLFSVLSSVVFACLFEWPRIQIILSLGAKRLDTLDKALLLWLLVSKSCLWFLPILFTCFVLKTLRLSRLAPLVLAGSSISLFHFLATDLISVGFTGYHAWDYWLPLREWLADPDFHVRRWAIESLTLETVVVFGIFFILGTLNFILARWISAFAGRYLFRFSSVDSPAPLIAAYVVVLAGVMPGMALFSDRHVLDRSITAVIPTKDLRHYFLKFTGNLANRESKFTSEWSGQFLPGESRELQRGSRSKDKPRDNLSVSSDDKAVIAHLDPLRMSENPSGLVGRICQNMGLGGSLGICGLSVTSTLQAGSLGNSCDWLLQDQQNLSSLRLRYRSNTSGASRDSTDEALALKLALDASNPGPADPNAYVRSPALPNIVLIIFESFRHTALDHGVMPELDAWSRQGLRLERHYSGSNCSHLGLFSLFYGRSPLGYYQTLDRKIPPQLLETLRRSGYRITFLTSGEIKGHRGIDQFLNATYCDEIIFENQIKLHDIADWPGSDRGKLARLRNIIGKPNSQPQCVFFYLMSSHWRYAFPPEFDFLKEASGITQFFDPYEQIRSYMNRYINSLMFLEHELMKVLRSIDITKNVVLITGDHGEAMGEDGVFRHGTQMSEIQMRVPCVMVGAGVEPSTIVTATTHADLLPTLMHVLSGKSVTINNCQGRDLAAEREPADLVALAPANGMDWEGLLIIRENKRLAFETQTGSAVPKAHFVGVVDEMGLYQLRIDSEDHASSSRRWSE
jgi:hypothetical protein